MNKKAKEKTAYLKGRSYSPILLQFPEGLKQEALAYATRLEKEGYEVYLFAGLSFGACDLAIDEAKRIGAKTLIHFGHLPFPLPCFKERPRAVRGKLENVEKEEAGRKGEGRDEGELEAVLPETEYIGVCEGIRVEFIPYRAKPNIAAISTFADFVSSKFKCVSLATTAQHIHYFDDIVEELEGRGVRVTYKKGSYTFLPGQILGCDPNALDKEAEAYFIWADGLFHATALSLSTQSLEKKAVFVVDPMTGKAKDVRAEIERLRKRQKAALAAAIQAERFGILLSTKPGQSRIAIARNIKRELEALGKQAAILVANTFTREGLENFNSFDVYIDTACLRLADDNELFGKPILHLLTYRELVDQLSRLKQA